LAKTARRGRRRQPPSQLTETDCKAIATYIKSLPAVEGHVSPKK